MTLKKRSIAFIRRKDLDYTVYNHMLQEGYIDTYAGVQEDNGFSERNYIRYIV